MLCETGTGELVLGQIPGNLYSPAQLTRSELSRGGREGDFLRRIPRRIVL